ncbi:ribosome small subunit-dependent GTPase A [Vibrio cyclitrophicus]|uniref:ribosome small subunit-dependent GTPase A n=1 Tax=Vibrio cyclitrophicus TaxID=47951 RepID=UPI000C8213F5|nr:ribosome small subunit-dependent GTPase A [Vibrio cyclitrophicus]NOH43329.1 ribosome small subunit-dependent GTPase A [Vibrio cyclitrophicus]NOI36723.1 ribosome small subunit-dependent GTPase A [Vibrio cyclitrophicus]PMJ99569.1 ribosome small subunit-dependent GTPase A [Vibrio cyclitrophicus]
MNSIFTHPITLTQLGWQAYFTQQLTLADYDNCTVGRVISQHKSGYIVTTKAKTFHLDAHMKLPSMTVGDWLLLSNETLRFERLLERKSLFKRKAPGTKVKEQMIAANVDTLFIVCSLNHDFNLSRIERYLALAKEAKVEPVVVLTKADLCDDADEKRERVQKLDALLVAEVVNALEAETLKGLRTWCNAGQTVAFMGSSGVGKSTLINTLAGEQAQETSGIREDDSKGRHTTTYRMLLPLPEGALLMDTPGLRELQLTSCEEGVAETFADIDSLVSQCRFSDCQHQSEPGCAVRAAIEAEEIDQRRLDNYNKLLREQARNGATLAERRSTDKQFGKMCKTIMSAKTRARNGA